MNFEPQKLFIGLMDFFTILLPGALLSILLMVDFCGSCVLEYLRTTTPHIGEIAVFLGASYLIGHLIFLVGSWLDHLYDWLRGQTLNKQIHLLAWRGKSQRRLARFLIWLMFKDERNVAVDCAGRIKRQSLGRLQARGSINNFQWCKAFLTLESQESLATVQRFEADSKFFRSFVIVLGILVAVWTYHCKYSFALIALILIPIAFLRYVEQRFKSTNQAYWAVITFMAERGKLSLDSPARDNKEPTHAGGVVFRENQQKREYLLVEASESPHEWVLPKGHIELDESPRETAVREVHEETGVWAKVQKELTCVPIPLSKPKIRVQFYLMEAMWCGRQSEPKRRHKWLSLDDAIDTMEKERFPESKKLLNGLKNVRKEPRRRPTRPSRESGANLRSR